MPPRFYDAHNHLQDDRLRPLRAEIIEAFRREGVIRMVVNGSAESDWADVLGLARTLPEVMPSFGYHPWYVRERTPAWKECLLQMLEAVPAAIGEIGLDHWIKDRDDAQQEEVFLWQLRLAAERNLPISIHCLQAWGRLLELLRQEARPQCGFLLHSYGGSRELIQPLAELGAYFSLPGYFALEQKERQREAFKHVPRDRLLIETDAPDQCLPREREDYSLRDAGSGKPLNHPANLPAVYRFASDLLQTDVATLSAQVEQNFQRLFDRPLRKLSSGQSAKLPPDQMPR